MLRAMLTTDKYFLGDIGIIVFAFSHLFRYASPAIFSQEMCARLFDNASAIYNLHISFRREVESALADVGNIPIGTIFEKHFCAMKLITFYKDYALSVSGIKDDLSTVCTSPEHVKFLKSWNMVEATRYLLPSLLSEPLYYIMHLMEFIGVGARSSAHVPALPGSCRVRAAEHTAAYLYLQYGKQGNGR